MPVSGEPPKKATRDRTIAAESRELLNELWEEEPIGRMMGGRGFGSFEKVIMAHELQKPFNFIRGEFYFQRN